jgi:putative hydrolase of the HAD superfamily
MIDRKYLIFDLGGVLLDIFPPATAEALAALGVREEHITDGLTLENPLLHSIECGNSTREELFAAIAESIGKELTPSLAEEIRAAWCALLGTAPAWKFARLRALHEKGYKIFLLSNTNAIHWETITKIVTAAEGKQLEEYFDGVYLSFEMHCRKPDVAIFEQLLQAEGIAAEEAVFFDDSSENCNAAASIGIESHLMERNGNWPDWLN